MGPDARYAHVMGLPYVYAFAASLLLPSLWTIEAVSDLLPCSVLQATTMVALLLLTVHLSRRELETIFMMKYPVTARMHVIAYLFGLRYGFINSILNASTFRSYGCSWALYTLTRMQLLCGFANVCGGERLLSRATSGNKQTNR